VADYLEKLKEEYPGMFGPVGAAPAIASHEFTPVGMFGDLWSDYVRPGIEWAGEKIPFIGRSETSDPSWRAPVHDRLKEEREAAEEYRRRSEEDMRRLEEETREYEETFKKIDFDPEHDKDEPTEDLRSVIAKAMKEAAEERSLERWAEEGKLGSADLLISDPATGVTTLHPAGTRPPPGALGGSGVMPGDADLGPLTPEFLGISADTMVPVIRAPYTVTAATGPEWMIGTFVDTSVPTAMPEFVRADEVAGLVASGKYKDPTKDKRVSSFFDTLPAMVDPTFEAAPSTHYSDPLKHWDTETVPGHLPLDLTDTPFYSAVMGEEHKYFPEDVAPVTPVDDFSSMPLDAATRAMIDADMEAGIHPAVASLSPVSLPSGGAFTSPSMAPDIGLEPGGMAGPGSGTDPTTHGVGPAVYGTGSLAGRFGHFLGGLTSDIGTGETYGPAFVDTYSDMMAGKPSSGVDTSHTGSYYAAGTSPVDAFTRLTGPEFGDLFSDREISIDSPALTSSLASIAASPVSAVPGPYGVSSTSVVPSGWITPDIDPETERMLTGRVHAISPEDISVTHSPHATIATVSEPTAKVGGTTTMTVRDVMPAPVSVPASLVAEVLAPTPHLDSRTVGGMSGRERAEYEALIDAFEHGRLGGGSSSWSGGDDAGMGEWGGSDTGGGGGFGYGI